MFSKSTFPEHLGGFYMAWEEIIKKVLFNGKAE
jgi:hypothetical protein